MASLGLKVLIASKSPVSATTTAGIIVTTFSPQGANIVSLLEDSGVRIIGKPVEREVSWILSTLLSWFQVPRLVLREGVRFGPATSVSVPGTGFPVKVFFPNRLRRVGLCLH